MKDRQEEGSPALSWTMKRFLEPASRVSIHYSLFKCYFLDKTETWSDSVSFFVTGTLVSKLDVDELCCFSLSWVDVVLRMWIPSVQFISFFVLKKTKNSK